MCYDHQKYVCEVISEVNIELILHIIGFVEIVWDFDNKIHFSVYMHAMFNQITIMFVGFVYVVFFIVFDRYTNIQQHPVWVMWSNLSFIIARKLKYICYQLDNSSKCVLHVGLNSSRFGRLIFVSLVTW
jgi:hypothetical protein